MASPQIKVEIAFDSGFTTPEGSRTWTDVTDYAEDEAEITYGRSDELAVPDPNQASFTLDNRDGRFTPELASSPYYPNVKKGKPVRLSVRDDPAESYSVRFVGYIDEWPLRWPDGSSAASTITISASSRRARLSRGAALTMSPIRAAYMLPDEPQAYWAMNRTWIAWDGQEQFFDETNLGADNELTQNRIAVFSDTDALYPSFITNPRPGPVDENNENADGQPIGLLMFPKYTDSSLTGTYPHYVGAGNACRIGTAGELTIEFVARIDALVEDGVNAFAQLARLVSTTGDHIIVIEVAAWGAFGTGLTNVSCGMSEATTTGVRHWEDSSYASGFTQPAEFEIANDGEIHHYAFTLTSAGTVGTLYLDGAVSATVAFSGSYVFSEDFTGLVLGADTHNTTVWMGHVAVRDEALTAGEILDHARAATTPDETIEERMERVFGYTGIPAAEITAETSVALAVGDQSQKGRAPADVIDELAEGTGGILYDKRDGTLTMQARNHRYNQTAAFSLNATTQEIEGDLTAVLDDRYLVNYVETKRTNTDDLPWFMRDSTSIAAYGTYNAGTIELPTTSWEEAQAAAVSLVYRYAEPKVRISTVTVDVVNLSTSQRALVLAADIGTLFTIASLPGQAPSSSMPLYLEGYSETITPTGHVISMNTTPGGWDTNVAVLNDAAHNVLGSGITTAY
jgi:hypothetical protein